MGRGAIGPDGAGGGGSRLEGCQVIKKRAWRVELRVNV